MRNRSIEKFSKVPVVAELDLNLGCRFLPYLTLFFKR